MFELTIQKGKKIPYSFKAYLSTELNFFLQKNINFIRPYLCYNSACPFVCTLRLSTYPPHIQVGYSFTLPVNQLAYSSTNILLLHIKHFMSTPIELHLCSLCSIVNINYCTWVCWKSDGSRGSDEFRSPDKSQQRAVESWKRKSKTALKILRDQQYCYPQNRICNHKLILLYQQN